MTAPRRRGHDCLFCDVISRTVTDHMAHVHSAHPDAIGRGRTKTLDWSCWSCATVNPPARTTCTNCGWVHPYAEGDIPITTDDGPDTSADAHSVTRRTP